MKWKDGISKMRHDTHLRKALEAKAKGQQCPQMAPLYHELALAHTNKAQEILESDRLWIEPLLEYLHAST